MSVMGRKRHAIDTFRGRLQNPVASIQGLVRYTTFSAPLDTHLNQASGWASNNHMLGKKGMSGRLLLVRAGCVKIPRSSHQLSY